MRPLHLLLAEPRVLTDVSIADPAVNSVAGLIDMMREVGRSGIVVEVGSYRGVSTEVLAHFCDHLIAVDHWYCQERPKREFDARFADCHHVSSLRVHSLQAALMLADGIAGLVYLDADHSEEAVRQDIAAWRRKVKLGGYLAGHDYYLEVGDTGTGPLSIPGWRPDGIQWYLGVKRAVDAAFGKPDAVFSDSSWLKRL